MPFQQQDFFQRNNWQQIIPMQPENEHKYEMNRSTIALIWSTQYLIIDQIYSDQDNSLDGGIEQNR